MTPEILVTGATGLSGSIVIREFIRQNIPVRALVRDKNKAQHLASCKGVELYEADLLKPETLTGAFEGISKALLISVTDENMPVAQKGFIDAAIKAELPHLNKWSGYDTGIGFNGHNFIAQAQHAEVEDYLVDSGVNWTIIRVAQFMQFYLPGTATGVSLDHNALVLPIANAKLAPVAIEDVAKIAAAILTTPDNEGRIYEVSGPDAMNMEEACEIISRVSGRKISFNNITLMEYREMLTRNNVPDFFIRVLTEISKERKKCLDSHIWLDSHKKFGIRPTNFAEFIYQHQAAFN